MGFMIFLTAMLFIAASAAGCFPDKQKTAFKLSAAACVMIAVTAAAQIAVKEGMFSDFYALPQGVLLRAAMAVVLTAAAGTGAALLIGRIIKMKK